MGHIQTYTSQHPERFIDCGIDHTPKARWKNDVRCFTHVSSYSRLPLSIYVYIIEVVISDPRRTECSNLTEARQA